MATVYDTNGKTVEEVQLPQVFSTPYRPEIIRRAVLATQSARRQPYGANVLAGKRTSAHYHGRRKYRFTMMNREMARIARIHGKVGSMAMRARFVPQAVKGRKAHPPKAEKVWTERINEKEKQLAVQSALAATARPELVKGRGHIFSVALPIILVNDFENVSKTKEVKKALDSLLAEELKRCSAKKVRAGKGKMRGRKYRKKTGPLLVVSKNCSVVKAGRNIPGVAVATADALGAELLAPGTHAGRLTIFTKAALGRISEKFS